MFSARAPAGRGELLAWLNTLVCAEYPSAEAIADAVAVAQAIEMAAAGDEPPLLHRLHSFDCALAPAHMVDTPRGRRGSGAARGGASEATVGIGLADRERNWAVVADAVRALPARRRVALDAPRLAAGKLQDIVRLLQWLHGLVSAAARRGALRFAVEAEGRRLAAADGRPLAPHLAPPPDSATRHRRGRLIECIVDAEGGVAGGLVDGVAPDNFNAEGSEAPVTNLPAGRPSARASGKGPVRGAREAESEAAESEAAGLLRQLEETAAAQADSLATLQRHLRRFAALRDSFAADGLALRGAAARAAAVEPVGSAAGDLGPAVDAILAAGTDPAALADLPPSTADRIAACRAAADPLAVLDDALAALGIVDR